MDAIDVVLLILVAIGLVLVGLTKWLAPSNAEYQAMRERAQMDDRQLH